MSTCFAHLTLWVLPLGYPQWWFIPLYWWTYSLIGTCHNWYIQQSMDGWVLGLYPVCGHHKQCGHEYLCASLLMPRRPGSSRAQTHGSNMIRCLQLQPVTEHCLLKWKCQLTESQATYELSHCSRYRPILEQWSRSLFCAILIGEAQWLWVFNLNFPDDYRDWLSLHSLIGYLVCSFCNTCSRYHFPTELSFSHSVVGIPYTLWIPLLCGFEI